MYQKKVEAVLQELNSSEKGISSHDAEVRLHKYGLNELKAQEGLHPLRIFLEQFASPLVWILIFALSKERVFKHVCIFKANSTPPAPPPTITIDRPF